jgi:hypothetical protein
MAISIDDVLNASMEERAALETTLRDVLSGRYPDLTDEEIREIEEAIESYRRNPHGLIPAEEVFERLRLR